MTATLAVLVPGVQAAFSTFGAYRNEPKASVLLSWHVPSTGARMSFRGDPFMSALARNAPSR